MDTFFRIINTFPVPLWLAMMFAPQHPLTQRAGRSSSIFIIAALSYVIALVVGIFKDAGEERGLPDFTSLDGISQLFATKEGALGGWSHMLALDLFTGAWIYRQCQRLNAPAWVRIPALLFTWFTGPFGLFLFLAWRLLIGRQGEALPLEGS